MGHVIPYAFLKIYPKSIVDSDLLFVAVSVARKQYALRSGFFANDPCPVKEQIERG